MPSLFSRWLSPPTENLVVFPAEVAAAEALLTTPRTDRGMLRQLRMEPSVELEQVLSCAWDYIDADRPREAAAVMALFFRRLQAGSTEISRVQLGKLHNAQALWLDAAGEAAASRAVFEFCLDMFHDRNKWRSQVPRGIRVLTGEPPAELRRLTAQVQIHSALQRSNAGEAAKVWDPFYEALVHLSRNGMHREATIAAGVYLSNAYLAGTFDMVAAASQPLLRLMISDLQACDPGAMARLGVYFGLSRAELGDLVGAVICLKHHLNLVQSAGYPEDLADEVAGAFRTLKARLVEKAASGAATLAEAIVADQDEVVRTMVERGADLNKSADLDQLPLLLACTIAENPRIAPLLLDAGADPNVEGANGITALALTAGFTDRLELVEHLLAQGARVDQASPMGWTPLLMAVRRHSSPAIVRALLAAGADPRVETKDGHTALKMSSEGFHAEPEIARLIREALAAR